MSDEKQEHRWVKLKRNPWFSCARCDLLLLKNAATERAVKRGCVGQLITITGAKSHNQREAERG